MHYSTVKTNPILLCQINTLEPIKSNISDCSAVAKLMMGKITGVCQALLVYSQCLKYLLEKIQQI